MAPRAAARERTQELMGQPPMPSMAMGMRFAPSGDTDPAPATTSTPATKEEPASTPAQIQAGKARDAMGLVALNKAVRGSWSAPVEAGVLGTVDGVIMTDDANNVVLQEVVGDNRTFKFARADFCRLNPSADMCVVVATPKATEEVPAVVITDAAVKTALTAAAAAKDAPKTKPMSSAPLTVGPSIPEMKVTTPVAEQTVVTTHAITAEESNSAIQAQAVILSELQKARDSYEFQRNIFIFTTVLGVAATGGTYWYLTKDRM